MRVLGKGCMTLHLLVRAFISMNLNYTPKNVLVSLGAFAYLFTTCWLQTIFLGFSSLSSGGSGDALAKERHESLLRIPCRERVLYARDLCSAEIIVIWSEEECSGIKIYLFGYVYDRRTLKMLLMWLIDVMLCGVKIKEAFLTSNPVPTVWTWSYLSCLR